MGQSQSSFPKSNCRQLSNDEVVFYIKQYFTMNELIDILIDVENGKITDLSPNVKYLIDISKTVPDIYSGQPTELSVQLFNPKVELVGIEENKPIEILYTVLHKYNDYVLKEMSLLDDTNKKQRAKILREEMVEISKKLLTYITQFCSDVGIISQ